VKPKGLWIVLILIAAQRANAAEESPPLVYSVNLRSEAVNAGAMAGLVPNLIGKTYQKAHEQFLDALKQTSGNESPGTLRPLACAEGPCRRLIEQPAKADPGWLPALLSSESTHRARVATINIIFDGRFFQVPVTFIDARLDDSGKVVMENPMQISYIRTYSRSLHAEDIRTQRNDVPFEGKIGSREAQWHFWLGGSAPRLPAELNHSFELIAALLTARLSAGEGAQISSALANKKALPRVRDITGKDPACKVLHGAFPVVKDLGEYLWIAVPGDASKVGNSMFIEPRCGFDY